MLDINLLQEDIDPEKLDELIEARTAQDKELRRSLRKINELYYACTSNLRQIQRWSKRFSWVERMQAFDAWLEICGTT